MCRPRGGPYVLDVIGTVRSSLADPAKAPKQGHEGAPEAWLVVDERIRDGLRDANPLLGVFATRSADPPNPIGLHRVRILAVEGTRVRVRDLEAVDGTPVLDLKPVLDHTRER